MKNICRSGFTGLSVWALKCGRVKEVVNIVYLFHHNSNLINLMNVAHLEVLVLNSKKQSLTQAAKCVILWCRVQC